MKKLQMFLMIVSSIFIIEGLGYHTNEGLADVISEEVAEVEDCPF